MNVLTCTPLLNMHVIKMPDRGEQRRIECEPLLSFVAACAAWSEKRSGLYKASVYAWKKGEPFKYRPLTTMKEFIHEATLRQQNMRFAT